MLERNLLLLPDNAAMQSQIGLARYLGGWRKEAQSALLTAALLEPRNPGLWYRLAIFYRDTGRSTEAAEIARRLIDLRPDSRMFRQLADETHIPEPHFRELNRR